MTYRVLRMLLIGWLAALAAVTVYYAVTKTFDDTGGIDFHSYWYSGHFVRQRSDPYGAYLTGIEPDAPVSYLDGATSPGSIAWPGMATVPANTAPIVIATSTLALFSWPVARLLWLGINLALMLIIPGLVIRLLPEDAKFTGYAKALIYLAFIGMFGTRNTAGNGQTSLLIFAFMLLAVIAARRHSWLVAGIWLGLALSKYSLAIPVFIYFIIKRQFGAAIAALLFQAIAAAALAAWTGTSPLAILAEYIGILQVHTSLPGIHLSSLFPDAPFAGFVAATSMTVAVAVALIFWLRKDATRRMAETWLEQISDLHVLSALTLWTLLVAYHRAYDSFVAILFFALVIFGLTAELPWRLSARQRKALGIGAALAYIPLSMPARGITFFMRDVTDESLLRWLDFQGGLLTLTLLALLAVVLWLLHRVEAPGLKDITARLALASSDQPAPSPPMLDA